MLMRPNNRDGDAKHGKPPKETDPANEDKMGDNSRLVAGKPVGGSYKDEK